MKDLKINLSFKEERQYLNGADFYLTIEKTLNSINKGWLKKLTFKKFAYNQCIISFEKPDIDKKIIGTGIWVSSNESLYKIWIIETSLPVVNRVPFKEEDIFKQTELFSNEIKIDKKNTYSVIENIVSLTKRLNYQLSPVINGKWIFGQIDLFNKLPNDYNQIKIIRNGERNNRFSRNLIIIDNSTYGEIRFIVGEP